MNPTSDPNHDSPSPLPSTTVPVDPALLRVADSPSKKPPTRSQSPAKRLKSEEPPSDLLPPPEPMEDIQHPDGPPVVDATDGSGASRPETTAATASFDSSTSSSATNSSVQMPSTAASSVDTSPPPSVEEQVALVLQATQQLPKEGEEWFVISKRWLNRFLAQSPAQRKSLSLSKEDAEMEMGPIDNKPIVDQAQLGELNKKKESNRAKGVTDESVPEDFVPLVPGELGEDFEILPADVWARLVSWYGLAEGSVSIKRKAVNTGDVQNPNIQVELYPPTFIIYKLRNPSRAVSQDLLQNEKSQSPKKVIAGKGEGFQKFLAKVKALTDTESKRKIRLWKVPVESTEPAQEPSTNKSSKASSKDKGTGRFKQMVIDLKDFLDLKYGEERELVDLPDHTHDQKYNGSMKIDTAGLSAGATIIVEEQSSDGEWVSETPTKTKSKFGQTITVAKNGNLTAKKSLNNSRSSSPSKFKSSIMTRGREKKEGRPKGTCGLSNLGNTCYMNSALQCLRSVEELSKYFLSDDYEHELNPSNPLSHNGKVAKAYASLLKSIFSPARPSSFSPRDFKYTIGRFGPSFSGYQQQDSQEFLAFLLDGLHEDLNRIKNKPYIEKPDSTDEMVGDNEAIAKLAETHWDIFKKRNDSAVADLFGGLYKSTLVCPECDKVSITFDPFMDLTLPLPIESNWAREVIFVPRSAENGGKLLKIPVELEKHASIKTLKDYLGKKFGIAPNRLMGSEVYKHKFYKHYLDSEALSEVIHQNDDPYFYELDEAPTNWPPPKKQKKVRSMLSFGGSDDEEDAGPDSPQSERLLVPVFHKRTKSGYRGFGSEDSFGVPFFIVLDKDEQADYQAILEKLVEKYQLFTTRDLYDGLQREEEDEEASSSVEDVQPVQPHPEKTEDEEKDGFVDVSMKDAASMAGSDEAEKKPVKRLSRRKAPSYVSDLFALKYSKKAGGLVTGWSNLEPAGDLTDRMGDTSAPRQPKAKKSALFGAISTGFSGRQSPASNMSDDDFQDAPEPQEDTMQGSSDEENNGTAFPHDFNNIPTNTFYGNSSNNSSTGPFRTPPRSHSPSAENGPLVRWGEALIVEWNDEGYENIFGGRHADDYRGRPKWDDAEFVEDTELNEKRKRREQRKRDGIDLEDCLDEFAKAETLSQDDLWYCPRCKELRQASKKFELWKCPDILVIHLKRFSSSRSFRDKIEVQVQCPTEGLDLSKRVGTTEGKGQVYDLFAVDNHYGGLGGGHYTAYVKNWVDGKWYYCDDSSVRESSADKVVTPAAYLLFYRRRSDKPLGGPEFARILSKSADESEDEGASSGPEPASSRETSPQPQPLLSTSPSGGFIGPVGNANLWGTSANEDTSEGLTDYDDNNSYTDNGVINIPASVGFPFGQNISVDEDEGIAADVEDSADTEMGTVRVIKSDEVDDDKADEIRLGDAVDESL